MTITKLIKQVSKINKEASEYIKDEAPKLDSYTEFSANLMGMFFWDETPQKYKYWNDIHKELTKQ